MPTPVDHYKKSYELHLQRLREKHGNEAEAVAQAVGGEFSVFGQLQFDLMVQVGLKPTDTLVDVGCGCGRLAFFLREYLRGKYYGFDVVADLVNYARTICERPDWVFQVGDGFSVPTPDESADFVCFFSVLTHLTPEDGYRYLQEALRTLKPGGRLVFSFLEFGVPAHWNVFQQNLAHQTKDSILNQFLSRDAVGAWAKRLGMEVCLILDSEKMRIPLSSPLYWSNGNVTEGYANLGQSVAVLSKGFNPLPLEKITQLSGDTEASAGHSSELLAVLELQLTTYRTQLAVENERHRQGSAAAQNEIARLHDELRTALTQLHRAHVLRQEDSKALSELKVDLENYTGKLRQSEDELGLTRLLAEKLGKSWLPGPLAQLAAPPRSKLRARLQSAKGSDLPGPAISYYLFTTPYRLFDVGRTSLKGWCVARTGQRIKAMRARLDERGYTGGYGFASGVAGETTPPTATHSQSGFEVEFEVVAGRQHLRLDVELEGAGWVTFLSTPVWSKENREGQAVSP